ncbi:MAG: hypothetical protein AB8B80_12005 [Marinicellaceae bacterium]
MGFKSQSSILNITSNLADNAAPLIAIDIIGKKVIKNQKIITESQAQIKILSHDNLSAFDKMYYRWNQDSLVFIDEGLQIIDIQNGLLSIISVDKLGNQATKQYTFLNE